MIKHPFQRTLGPGPYTFVGVGTIHMSETFGARYVGPECERGAGTCAHCNHAIKYIYVIRTAEGRQFGVGSDCILKLGDNNQFTNITAVERRVKLQKRNQAKARRETQRLTLKVEVESFINSNIEIIQRKVSKQRLTQNRTLNGYKFFLVELKKIVKQNSGGTLE